MAKTDDRVSTVAHFHRILKILMISATQMHLGYFIQLGGTFPSKKHYSAGPWTDLEEMKELLKNVYNACNSTRFSFYQYNTYSQDMNDNK